MNLVVSSSRDRTIRFWNTNSDIPVQKLVGHELVVTAIDLNPGRDFFFRYIKDYYRKNFDFFSY